MCSIISCDHYPQRLSWIKTPIETLGIVVTDNDAANYQHNFQHRILNLKTIINIWKQRRLSIKGKITILNNLELAPHIYAATQKKQKTKNN